MDRKWKGFLGGVGIFLAKKGLDKDKWVDISRVSDTIIIIKALARGIIISVISVYALQCCLVVSQKDDFYVARKLGEKEIVTRK